MKHNRKDPTGQQFSRLQVLGQAPSKVYAGGWTAAMWLCRCTCGSEKVVRAMDLLRGSATSCGCYQKENARKQQTTHGQTGTPEHHLWAAARDRHRRRGIQFDITLADIRIPEFCPVLGIRLEPGVGKFQATSPSLDRLNAHGGYTPANVVVMSFRANELKRDATLTELQAVLRYMQKGPPPEALVVEPVAPTTSTNLRGSLLGLRFGKLVVRRLHRGGLRGNCWECLCDCGNIFNTPASQLAIRRSCGCVPRGAGGGTHKESSNQGRGSDRYELWRGAKGRAREKDLPFSIKVQGITIPERCPVLGILLEPNIGEKTWAAGSPSLDRFNPALGYVPENTVVISQRANSLKSDATLNEMTALVRWLHTKET